MESLGCGHTHGANADAGSESALKHLRIKISPLKMKASQEVFCLALPTSVQKQLCEQSEV